MTLGQKLVAARKVLGMTQLGVAEAAGVNYKTLAGWEQDRVDPRFFDLCLVAGVLGLSLDYLAGRDDE